MDKIAVVIPCYGCRDLVLGVIARIGPSVSRVFVIDDKCPQGTGRHVQANCRDPRVEVIFHETNQGVGGAVITGYRAALQSGYTVAVKIDGDGQMDPRLINQFVHPILAKRADYVKGNRFYDIEAVKSMPTIRLLGNAALSFLSKLSSGYWDVFDPTNGYTAIHVNALKAINLDKLAKRYFFESDMLFRLNLARAVIYDAPMKAHYGDEKSNLRISRIVHEFFFRHFVNTLKRIFYNYFLRNFSIASLNLILGLAFLAFGTIFGIQAWVHASQSGVASSGGTVMLAALPVLIGVQFVLSFANFDMESTPRIPLSQNELPLGEE